MHIKNIHCSIEKLADCIKTQFEKGIDQIDTKEMGEAVEMLNELCQAEYYSKIIKQMDKAEEEDEEEKKYMLKRMKEEGEEDESRKFYRGRPKTTGRYISKRGYEEPMMDAMIPMEMYRDMDREHMGRMYYSGSGSSGGSGNTSGGMSGNSSSGMGGNSGGNMSGGNTRNYGGESGYSRDSREGKSGQSRKTYMEAKEMHGNNTPEAKQHKMRELENYTKELAEDMTEMVSGMSPEEKTMLKQKLAMLQQKIV